MRVPGLYPGRLLVFSVAHGGHCSYLARLPTKPAARLERAWPPCATCPFKATCAGVLQGLADQRAGPRALLRVRCWAKLGPSPMACAPRGIEPRRRIIPRRSVAPQLPSSAPSPR